MTHQKETKLLDQQKLGWRFGLWKAPTRIKKCNLISAELIHKYHGANIVNYQIKSTNKHFYKNYILHPNPKRIDLKPVEMNIHFNTTS